MKGLNEIRNEYGPLGLLRIIFYPITTLFITPLQLLRSLFSSLSLLKGKWLYYPHFNLLSSVNSTFYWTRALNLSWFGRSGTSPYLGLGNYNLSRCFHYTLFSLNAYWKAGAVTVITGMFIWLGSHFIWIEDYSTDWVISVLLLTFISTTFYANTFRQQNYNVVGWAFFPLFLYFLYNGYWMGAAGALFLVSFGSFTLVVVSGFYGLAMSIYFMSIFPLIALIPSILKIALHFYPVFRSGKGAEILKNVLKAIGTTPGKARYVRKAEAKINLKLIYFLSIYGQFFVFLYLVNDQIPILLTVAIAVFLINSIISRFADEQTMYMLLLTSAIPELIVRENFFLLISFWLVASPLPGFLGFDVFKKSIDKVVALKPFNIKPYFDAFGKFFNDIPQDQKVLFAWSDPGNQYEKVFDGYRRIYEVALYVATTKKIHFTPDWWTVFELNYEGAPDFWGRSVEEVKSKLDEWNSNFVVIYQEQNPQIDPKWEANGFKVLSELNWEMFSVDFAPYDKINVEGLRWWLLEFDSNGRN